MLVTYGRSVKSVPKSFFPYTAWICSYADIAEDIVKIANQEPVKVIGWHIFSVMLSPVLSPGHGIYLRKVQIFWLGCTVSYAVGCNDVR